MARRSEWPVECKVYVGGLSPDASSHELEDVFGRYGRLRKVWVARRPPGFAFLEFEDQRDAEDAVRALDGTRICGSRARVEMSSGRRRNRGAPGGGRDNGYKGGSGGYRRSRSPRGRSRSPVRRSRSHSVGDRKSYSRSPPPKRGSSRSRSRSRSAARD